MLAPLPSYPLFAQLAEVEGVKLVPYRLRYDGAWHIDVASAARRDHESDARGARREPEQPDGIVHDARRARTRSSIWGFPIACDEVFAEYMFRDAPDAVPCAAKVATRGLVFSLGGLSKLAALPQMKLAWMIAGGDGAIVAAALERLSWIADAYLSLATPVQHALHALLAAGETSRRAIAARTRRNLGALDRACRGTSATRLDVSGGWYATLRVARVRSEMETCLRALDAGVYVHPGMFFGFEDEAYVVVSLLAREADFDDGVSALLSTLE